LGIVAKSIDTLAQKRKPEFLLALGDNFYEDGVSSTTDRKWEDYWKKVYTGYLSKIPWYTVLGNHDWHGSVKAQLDKKDPIWVMPDHFYTKEDQVGNKTVGFVFVDTDLFQYGYDCSSKVCSKTAAYGWTRANNTIEKQCEWIETQFKKYSQKDYLIVVGHHNVGVCETKKEMPLND
jgi:predicted MPP superfamily phosphohydrolase